MIFVYLTLMISLLTIFGKCFGGYVNMGLNLNPRTADSSSEKKIVLAAGYRLDPSNVEAIRTLKDSKPSTVGEVGKLLGLLGYYRRYIQNFAKIAHPLFQLLQATSEDVTKLAHKSKQHSNHGSVPSVIWTEQHQKEVETLLDHLVSPPILGYPNFSKSFVLHTDASQQGLGAVLHQKQYGRMRVTGYGSRSLTKVEKNYYLHSGKLKLLALKMGCMQTLQRVHLPCA